MATVDIPGTFMKAYMEFETVHMKMEGKMADLLMKLDPKLYRKYATNKKIRIVLYMELKNTYMVRSKPRFCSEEI